MTRLLIVDDSEVVVETIKDMVSNDPDIHVVGCAVNGKEAIEKAETLRPDIITMDLHMPEMGGMEAIEKIMADNPTPIVIISDDYTEHNVFKALDIGVSDVMPKSGDFQDPNYIHKFCEKLKKLAYARVVRYIDRKTVIRPSESSIDVVGIVASTGGPAALKTLLGSLPRERNYSILVVQHMAEGFTQGLVKWLDTTLKNCHVQMVEKNSLLLKGSVMFAPDNRHLVIGLNGFVHLSDDPPHDGHRPSGTILLESIAKRYGSKSVGVILTGMGSDGVVGANEIRQRGGKLICQDEETSMVFGMPKEVMRTGRVDYVLPINQIAGQITELSNG